VAREAGLDVKLDLATPSAPLPSAVDHTVYRILQESITNVIRHVGPTRVTVALDYGTEVLEVRVTDEGSPELPDQAASRRHPPVRVDGGGPAEAGRGIIGMRERCGLLGGELTAGPRPCGGYEVRARLPLASVGSGDQ
jgi:signal transduction histidine kinase